MVQPGLGVLDQQATGVAEVGVVGVEQVGGQDGAQVHDGLLVRRHVPLAEGPKHLIGVQLLVELPLTGGVIFVLGEQRPLIVGARLSKPEARRHRGLGRKSNEGPGQSCRKFSGSCEMITMRAMTRRRRQTCCGLTVGSSTSGRVCGGEGDGVARHAVTSMLCSPVAPRERLDVALCATPAIPHTKKKLCIPVHLASPAVRVEISSFTAASYHGSRGALEGDSIRSVPH